MLKKRLDHQAFKIISETVTELGVEAWLIGGFVRDLFLDRDSKDIDVVVLGSGEAGKYLARKN